MNVRMYNVQVRLNVRMYNVQVQPKEEGAL